MAGCPGLVMGQGCAPDIHCAASRAGHRPELTKTWSCHPLAEGRMVEDGHSGGITNNSVLEGAGGFAVCFMKVSPVCSCGD